MKGVLVDPVVRDLGRTPAVKEPLWNYTVVGLH